MKIIYIPENFHLIVNLINKTIINDYSSSDKLQIINTSDFKLINIIVSLEKDEIQISSLFKYDLTEFTIVETQNYYYISMSMYTACDIAYRIKEETDFSETLLETIRNVIPNIFNYNKLMDYVSHKLKHSFRTINYRHIYLDILDDVYTVNNAYMKILAYSELSREELNKLFRISVKWLLPIRDIVKLKSIKSINIVNNEYNYYKNLFYDAIAVQETGSSIPNIIQYLKCISIDDKYTNSGVSVEFKTSVADINKFTQKTFNSYKDSNLYVTNILPISTMADLFMSISLNDISEYSKVNETVAHLRDILIFRNNYMNFALNGHEEE